MRPQALLRRSQFLLKTSTASLPVLTPSTSLLRSKNHSITRTSITVNRFSSSFPPNGAPESSATSQEPNEDTVEPPAEELDKPKARRTKVTSSASKESEGLELPEDLDILWLPEEENPNNVLSYATSLPPTELFEEALNNLLVALHPQTQHRAVYASSSESLVEPTLGLYCPIEGGEYVIDATVRELAQRTGSEVMVLDAVQLAAGEWGQFGKAGSALQLPKNPLHFQVLPSMPSPSTRNAVLEDDDDDFLPEFGLLSPPQQMTLTVLAPTLQGRTLMAGRRSSPSPSRTKVFFDALMNAPLKQDSSSPSTSRGRPRLIYVRDFPTLAPSSYAWFPPLLSAVRQRRRGPLSRPSSPVPNPTVIIFGMTPSLLPSSNSTSPSPGRGMGANMFDMNNSPQVTKMPKPDLSEWTEDETSEKARERRLQERIKLWEKNETAFYDEFSLSAQEEGSSQKPNIVMVGGLPPPFFPPPDQPTARGSDSQKKTSFFRTCTLVPDVRSHAQERSTRVARRREINELTMRMGVGAIGGIIEKGSAAAISISDLDADSSQKENSEKMWEVWGNSIEVWPSVQKIADRAMGNTIASREGARVVAKLALSSTTVPWPTVHAAWAAQRDAKDRRKHWFKETSNVHKNQLDGTETGETGENQPTVDEIVERVKNEGDLNAHETRLLSCIVDPNHIHTTFNQVHLPPHTIDSVRTIVSLPLINPAAFKQGILKEHSMTGCLLFGPPGTGKTLVVRALAKEAGCRMLTISPSDVMDMYVGEGEKLVRAVFSLARKLSPCVVFLDEIDALFGARMSGRETGSAIVLRGVLTEFMQEMDGLKSSNDDNVIVIGATNRPFDLDDAVLRRLPRRLLVDLPGEKEREAILKIHLRDETLADEVDIKALAKKAESFSGSDLKHLCVSAALDAVKEHIHVPWALSSSTLDSSMSASQTVENSSISETSSRRIPEVLPSPKESDEKTLAQDLSGRVLYLRNFDKALTEIVPSSSEALGSLSELRKWNEEFGEGRRDRKRQQVWGKGRFGFIDRPEKDGEGKVVIPRPTLAISLDRTSELSQD